MEMGKCFSFLSIVFVYVSFLEAKFTQVHIGSLITTANGHRDLVQYPKTNCNRFDSYELNQVLLE